MCGSFRLSLEQNERARPPNSLGYQPVTGLSRITKSARGAGRGQRGLGANGEEWWCLRCVESLAQAMQQCELELLPPSPEPLAHTLFDWPQWIVPEERNIPGYPGKFRLEAPYRYGLEKWKAVILYNSQQKHGVHFTPDLPPHLSITDQLYTGTDGRSLYLSKESRDVRGVMENGEEAEISAADCEDVSLTEVLSRVGRLVAAVTREKGQRRLAKKKRRLGNWISGSMEFGLI